MRNISIINRIREFFNYYEATIQNTIQLLTPKEQISYINSFGIILIFIQSHCHELN